MADQLNQLPPDLQVDFDAVKRRQALADSLLRSGLEGPGPGRQVGRFYVRPHPLEGLASMVQTGVGAYMGNKNQEAYKDLATRYNRGLGEAVTKYNTTYQGTPEIESPPDEIGGGPGRPAVEGDPNRAITEAITSNYGPVRELGRMGMQHQQRLVEAKEKGEQTRLTNLERDERIFNDRQKGRDSAMQLLLTKLQTPNINDQERNATMKEIAKIRAQNALAVADQRTKQGGGKPMPAPITKMQDEGLQAIGEMHSVNGDLAQIVQEINSGQLNLSLLNNLYQQGRNFLGISTPEGVRLQSLKSTLERLRNATLLIAKGVQTEGDAVRAWDQLMANLNDKNVVQSRLSEIMRQNSDNVEKQKARIGIMRNTYGQAPLNFDEFEFRPGALGGVPGAPTPTAPPMNPRPQGGAFPPPPRGAVTRIQ